VLVYIRSIYYVRKHVIYARRVYVSLRRVDRTRENPLTTPHSTYYYNICILHVVNAYQQIALAYYITDRDSGELLVI